MNTQPEWINGPVETPVTAGEIEAFRDDLTSHQNNQFSDNEIAEYIQRDEWADDAIAELKRLQHLNVVARVKTAVAAGHDFWQSIDTRADIPVISEARRDSH